MENSDKYKDLSIEDIHKKIESLENLTSGLLIIMILLSVLILITLFEV